MKFNKENLQKVALAVLLGVAGLYYYGFEMMGPLGVKEKMTANEITSLEGKIKEARSKIAQTKAIEASDASAETAKKAYDVMQAKIPSGDPLAWLPTRLTEFFKSRGIPKQSFRCNLPLPDPGLPGFQLSSWSVDLPGVSFAVFGKALAGLENQEGLMQIMNLQMETMAKDPESPHVQITFSTLVKSEK